jgi:hypothetical protein
MQASGHAFFLSSSHSLQKISWSTRPGIISFAQSLPARFTGRCRDSSACGLYLAANDSNALTGGVRIGF